MLYIYIIIYIYIYIYICIYIKIIFFHKINLSLGSTGKYRNQTFLKLATGYGM